MKKYILLMVLSCLVTQGMAFSPLVSSSIKAPEGCIDKDITAEELGLTDLMQIGICTNPSLSAEYMGVKAKEASLGNARSQYLPSISLTGTASITGTKPEGQDYTQDEPYYGGATANWLLFDFGARESRVNITKAYLQAANHSYNAALQDLMLSVQTSYLHLLAAKESLVSAKASLDTYKQSYEEAEKRYKLGMVSLSDKLQINTQYKQAQLSVISAENQVKQYEGSLAVLLNLSPDTNLKIKQPAFDDNTTKIENDNVQELMQLALNQRQELKAQENLEKAAKSNLTATKTQLLPSISANANIGFSDNWKHNRDFNATTYPYSLVSNSAGLSVSMPLFTGFSNLYQIKNASYAYNQTVATTQNLKLQIQNEVWSAYQSYKTAERSYEISQSVLESAEENHRVAFRYYQVGKGDTLNLLTAVSQLADARQTKITAFYSLLLSKANLYRKIGNN